jgi:hypothetical protein
VGDNPISAGNQQERLSSEECRRWFLAGVIEGEGSVCVSIKRHPTAPLGYFVQPELFVYQHRCRRDLLEMARDELGGGWIGPKPGNPDVLVLKIGSRPQLVARVLPFLRTYMRFSSRTSDFAKFDRIVTLFERGRHRVPDGLAEIVRIACTMNMNGKQRRRPIEIVLDRILRGHTLNAPAKSEDMVRPPRRRGELDGTETV